MRVLFRVEHAGGARVDLDRLVPQQPAQHIEIVDHGVVENAVRHGGDRVGRRDLGIAAGKDQHFGSADLTGADCVVQRAVSRIEAPVEADAKRHPGLRQNVCARVDTCHVEIDRLLAEDRFAGLRRCLNDSRVRSWRCANDDRAHGRVGQRLRQVVPCTRAVFFSQRVRRVKIEVDDPRKTCARMRSHVCGVNGADEARADQAKIDHAG